MLLISSRDLPENQKPGLAYSESAKIPIITLIHWLRRYSAGFDMKMFSAMSVIELRLELRSASMTWVCCDLHRMWAPSRANALRLLWVACMVLHGSSRHYVPEQVCLVAAFPCHLFSSAYPNQTGLHLTSHAPSNTPYSRSWGATRNRETSQALTRRPPLLRKL